MPTIGFYEINDIVNSALSQSPPPSRSEMHLLEGNEPRRVGGSDTGSTVLHRLVRDAEFSEIMTNHFRLNFNLVEGLAVVDADNASDHVWQDDNVAKMSLHARGLLQCGRFLLRLAKTLCEGHRLAIKTTL